MRGGYGSSTSSREAAFRESGHWFGRLKKATEEGWCYGLL
jgi:hypothetical protein